MTILLTDDEWVRAARDFTQGGTAKGTLKAIGDFALQAIANRLGSQPELINDARRSILRQLVQLRVSHQLGAPEDLKQLIDDIADLICANSRGAHAPSVTRDPPAARAPSIEFRPPDYWPSHLTTGVSLPPHRERARSLESLLLEAHQGSGFHADEPANAEQLRSRLDAAGIPEQLWPTIARFYVQYLAESSGLDGSRYKQRLENLSELPWVRRTAKPISVLDVQRALDEDHAGLHDVKERILEFVSILERRARRRSTRHLDAPRLCLVGPPGVGKSTLARSIARGLGRRFVSVALGGYADAEGLRGWIITWRGSKAGVLVKTFIKAGARDAVIRFDEIDKTHRSESRGDPTDVLLHLFDPEHNHEFEDDFLEVPFDASEFVYIATANHLECISPELQDRSR